MRRLCIISLVVATMGLLSAAAWAGNQETANQIKANLQASGLLTDGTKITVRFQGGIARVSGVVRDEDQGEKILRVVLHTPGVSQIAPELTLSGAQGNVPDWLNPLRKTGDSPAGPNRWGPPFRRQERRPHGYGAAGSPAALGPAAGRRFRPRHVADCRCQWRTGWAHADVCPGRCRRSGPHADRPAEHARLRLAQLLGLSELRGRDLSPPVLADGLAVHRPLLSLSAGADGMAEGVTAMGRWLVVPGIPRQAVLRLVAVGYPGTVPRFSFHKNGTVPFPRLQKSGAMLVQPRAWHLSFCGLAAHKACHWLCQCLPVSSARPERRSSPSKALAEPKAPNSGLSSMSPREAVAPVAS